MIRQLVCLSLFLTAAAALVQAQQKPDFSGTWKLNVVKSDYGVIPGPSSRTDVIMQKEPGVTVHVTAEGDQGKMDYTVNYATDGKEVTNKVGDFESKSTAKWEGNNLVVNSKFKFNDMDVTGVATWTLSADSKTLNINVTYTSEMGEAA